MPLATASETHAPSFAVSCIGVTPHAQDELATERLRTDLSRLAALEAARDERRGA